MRIMKIIAKRLAHHFVLTVGFFALTICHLLALIIWPLGQLVGRSIHELEVSTKQLQVSRGRWR